MCYAGKTRLIGVFEYLLQVGDIEKIVLGRLLVVLVEREMGKRQTDRRRRGRGDGAEIADFGKQESVG